MGKNIPEKIELPSIAQAHPTREVLDYWETILLARLKEMEQGREVVERLKKGY